MFYLHMRASDFGLKADNVKAPYSTLEEAVSQAEHNIARGTQQPLRIVDEEGNLKKSYEEG